MTPNRKMAFFLVLALVPIFALAEQPIVIFAAGDVAKCANNTPGPGAIETAKLLDKLYKEERHSDALILALGDLAYNSGTQMQFAACYESTWGKYKDRTLPIPGNHEYYPDTKTGKGYNIAPYNNYWSSRLSSLSMTSGDPMEGYYQFEIGNWNIVGINSTVIVEDALRLEDYLQRLLLSNVADNVERRRRIANLKIEIGVADLNFMATLKRQNTWLRDEAFTTKKSCTLALMHHPRYSSGIHGNIDDETLPLIPLYEKLYAQNVSILLTAHDHNYEQFHPMDNSGHQDSKNGIRNFVVGTGGANYRKFGNIQPNSEVRIENTWGVLKLELFNNYYTWQFIPVKGSPLKKYREACVPR